MNKWKSTRTRSSISIPNERTNERNFATTANTSICFFIHFRNCLQTNRLSVCLSMLKIEHISVIKYADLICQSMRSTPFNEKKTICPYFSCHTNSMEEKQRACAKFNWFELKIFDKWASVCPPCAFPKWPVTIIKHTVIS